MRVGFPVAAVILGVSTAATAADIGWSVDAGLTHTDNAALTESGSVSDTLASVGGAIRFGAETRLIEASLGGQGSFQHYLEDTFSDDFVGEAVGNLSLALIPGRLRWSFEDRYGQLATSPFEPTTPDNRQNVNSFSTGPNLQLRLGDRSRLNLSAEYGDVRYGEATQGDTRNWGGSIAVERTLSRSSSFILTASQNRTAYDAPSTPLYDQQSLYATWQTQGTRQRVSADLGASRISIRHDDGRINPLLRIGWQRRITPALTMNLDLASEYQNSGELFVQQAAQANPGGTDIAVTNIPAATFRSGLSFTFARSRTSFSIGGGWTRLNYVGTEDLDQQDSNAYAEVRRRLRPRLQGYLAYRYARHDYENRLNDSTEHIAEAGMDLGVGRSLFLTLNYRHTDSDDAAATRTYSDNVIGLKLSWRSGDGASD